MFDDFDFDTTYYSDNWTELRLENIRKVQELTSSFTEHIRSEQLDSLLMKARFNAAIRAIN